GSAAPDCTAWAGLCAGDATSPALNGLPAGYRVPCIEIYARLANATEQATSVGTLAESDSQEGDEAATIELTLTNHGRHQPSGPNVRNADSVHNPGGNLRRWPVPFLALLLLR